MYAPYPHGLSGNGCTSNAEYIRCFSSPSLRHRLGQPPFPKRALALGLKGIGCIRSVEDPAERPHRCCGCRIAAQQRPLAGVGGIWTPSKGRSLAPDMSASEVAFITSKARAGSSSSAKAQVGPYYPANQRPMRATRPLDQPRPATRPPPDRAYTAAVQFSRPAKKVPSATARCTSRLGSNANRRQRSGSAWRDVCSSGSARPAGRPAVWAAR